MKTNSGQALFIAGILLVAGVGTGLAQPTILISNLNAPGPGGTGIGDIQAVLPGTGYAVGFLNGATPYRLESVTLEFIGTSLPAAGFSVEIYCAGMPGTVPPPGWPLVPYGQLGNPTIDPRPTHWPGQTTYVTFTPTAPITLLPSNLFWIGASEAANGNNDNGLLFAYAQTYNVAGGVQMYATASSFNQWELDPIANEWVSGSPSGYEGLKVELTGTAVPEPGAWALLLAGGAAFASWKGQRRRR
jgi:hypothetical protein